jgi:hypothetical protein
VPASVTFIPNSAFSVPSHAFVAGYEWRWRVLSSRGSAHSARLRAKERDYQRGAYGHGGFTPLEISHRPLMK